MRCRGRNDRCRANASQTTPPACARRRWGSRIAAYTPATREPRERQRRSARRRPSARHGGGCGGLAGAPRRRRDSCAAPQARIDREIEQVDGEIDGDDENGEQNDDVLDNDEIVLGDGLEDETAEPGQIEDVLDDDRAGEQGGELQP